MGIIENELSEHEIVVDPSDMLIIDEAKRKYGHLSKRVQAATTLEEMAPALRALATDFEVTNPNESSKILSFHKRNGLTGLHPDQPVAP